jgi:hypothetical protein
MRVDDVAGEFIAVVNDEGNRVSYYTSKTRADLVEFMTELAKELHVIEWRRYIVVEYSATFEGDGNDYHLGEELPTDVSADSKSKRKKRQAVADRVRAIRLSWEVWDYSTQPLDRPADGWRQGGKFLRRRRVLESGKPGHPEWTWDETLPAGVMPYSPERLKVLEEIQRALGKLDARMREFLAGNADALAARIDAMTDAGRLLGSGGAQ